MLDEAPGSLNFVYQALKAAEYLSRLCRFILYFNITLIRLPRNVEVLLTSRALIG